MQLSPWGKLVVFLADCEIWEGAGRIYTFDNKMEQGEKQFGQLPRVWHRMADEGDWEDILALFISIGQLYIVGWWSVGGL